MFSLIAMFGFFRAAKFWVAMAMAVVQFVQIRYGLDLGLDEATATAVFGGLGALLVWLVPNFKGKSEAATGYPAAPKGLY